MTTLLSVMSIFCVRAGCKTQMVSYAFKHTSQSFSDKPFVRICTHNLKPSGHMWMLSISNDCYIIRDILVWFRVAWEIQLERYCPRHTSVILYIQHFMNILQARTYIAIWWTTCMTAKLTYLMTEYYMALLPTMHSFIRTNLASYTAHCSVFF